MKTWIRLDNAAKIFPVTSKKYRTNLFRICFSLTEKVDPVCLQESLNIVIKRFKTFKLKLKSGIFWNYFEINKLNPLVYAEDPYLLKLFDTYHDRGYLFRITYFENKIGIEMFHAITDGFGATSFLKAICYEYLKLKGYQINDEGKILLDLENSYEESIDSFQTFYNKNTKTDKSEKEASHIKGTYYSDNYTGVITGILNRKELKEVCTKYDCTYTELITSIINYSASKNKQMITNINKPFQVFVPVDLRRKRPSKSLRNFSMVVRTSIMINDDKSLDDYINICKESLRESLKDENLFPRVAYNVKMEKLFILRIIPLFLKKIALKIGYHRMNTKANSFCISNLGDIDLPKDMEKYITKATFINGATPKAPLNIGMITYKDKVFISFSSSILERDFQRTFFKTLVSLGLDVTIENNDLEE